MSIGDIIRWNGPGRGSSVVNHTHHRVTPTAEECARYFRDATEPPPRPFSQLDARAARRAMGPVHDPMLAGDPGPETPLERLPVRVASAQGYTHTFGGGR